MLNAFGEITQVVAILLGAIFGIGSVIYKRKKGGLAKSDKFTVIGFIVAAVCALVTLAVDTHNQEVAQRKQLKDVSDQLSRQETMLHEIHRGQFRITNYVLGVEFTVSSSLPQLAPLVARWEKYIKSSKSTDFDSLGYSHDDKIFVVRNTHLEILQMYIDPDSSLFPSSDTPEHGLLLPILKMVILSKDAPDVATLVSTQNGLGGSSRFIDLALFMPLDLVNYKVREPSLAASSARPEIFGRIEYDRFAKTITVQCRESSATPILDTGAIISLLDLPNRQIALLGLEKKSVQSIAQIEINTAINGSYGWSGDRQVRYPDLKTATDSNDIIPTYRLKAADFQALRDSQ
ncbi:hypothetical protein [Dyella nitratireducens]|uniref:Peptidase A2 domain-containing protein n=1 Tax=Dyella nitratireducens TaxID=1849580 RepID=A0ABQ1GCN5_9GAMM|nr:hypothetical protein [Dyella nitratireducens]GGA41111.1 hypothetical protein GCM10010981_32890 [Dyella nitratireducens]GLQ40647.1 hypothetical protein GCM10007902_04960 [Dyella nitratireducens]